MKNSSRKPVKHTDVFLFSSWPKDLHNSVFNSLGLFYYVKSSTLPNSVLNELIRRNLNPSVLYCFNFGDGYRGRDRFTQMTSGGWMPPHLIYESLTK